MLFPLFYHNLQVNSLKTGQHHNVLSCKLNYSPNKIQNGRRRIGYERIQMVVRL